MKIFLKNIPIIPESILNELVRMMFIFTIIYIDWVIGKLRTNESGRVSGLSLKIDSRVSLFVLNFH